MSRVATEALAASGDARASNPSDELCWLSACEMASLVRRRQLSPVELIDAHLDRIERLNPLLNAYVFVAADHAREAAIEAERAVMSGHSLGPLHGIPIAVKDADPKANIPNTWGSKPLAQFVPNVSSPVVERLESAGAVVLGKTNMSEFGISGTTDNLLFGPTGTPFDYDRNAGGSSGGSASAVASGIAAAAQGSDGGGSIRIPAAWCGVVGLKASWGRIPLGARPDGFLHTPFVSHGPLCRTVDDTALMMRAMTGPHRRDPFSLPHKDDDLAAATRGSMSGMRIAFSPDFGGFPVSDEVGRIVRASVSALEATGANVAEIRLDLPRTPAELAECWTRQIAVLNAVTDLALRRTGVALLDEHSDQLTEPFRNSVEVGRRLTAVEYKRDDLVRTELYDTIESLFQNFELLVAPTTAVLPVPNRADGLTLGPSAVDGVQVDRTIGWALTYPINATGHPAASVPAGFAANGLPVGLQVIGPRWRDDLVLRAAGAIERSRSWYEHYGSVASASISVETRPAVPGGFGVRA